jgi:triacylglycerol lipase
MTFDPHNDVPTLEVLSPPVADYAYFQGCGVAFDPAATDYSPANAWWLAEAASLAYGDATFIKERFERSDLLRRQGMHWEMITSGDDTAGFVMHNDDVAIAVFRGTRVLGLQDPLALKASVTPVLRDVITDGRFPLTSFNPGCVHLGFAEAFHSLSTTLMPRLEQLNDGKRSMWFAGHSLGGALATVAAARFGLDRCNGLYTFGSPRVGDAEFCAPFKGHRCFRVVHHDDIVARIPPPIRYGHVGQLVYIARDGSVDPHADEQQITDIFLGQFDWASIVTSAVRHLQDMVTVFTHGLPARILDIRIPRAPVTDHAPIYYASFLKEAAARGA